MKARSEAAAAKTTVARQCTAVSKSTGRRCKRSAIHGAVVCPVHGGSAPQVKAAAARRVAEAEAQQAAAQTYIRLTGQQPGSPLEALKQLAGRFHAVENDLFARIAQQPDQMSTLLPAWGAAASRYLDVLTGWIRAEPAQSQANTILDLLNSLPDVGEQRVIPPLRQLQPATTAQEAPEADETAQEPSGPLQRQDGPPPGRIIRQGRIEYEVW